MVGEVMFKDPSTVVSGSSRPCSVFTFTLLLLECLKEGFPSISFSSHGRNLRFIPAVAGTDVIGGGVIVAPRRNGEFQIFTPASGVPDRERNRNAGPRLICIEHAKRVLFAMIGRRHGT